MALDKETLELVTLAAIRTMGVGMRKPTEVEGRRSAANKANLEELLHKSAAVKQQMEMRRKEQQLTCSQAHADGHTHPMHELESGILSRRIRLLSVSAVQCEGAAGR